MLHGTLGASLLGNLLTGGKGIVRAGEGSIASRAKGEGIVRAGEGNVLSRAKGKDSGSKKKT